MQGKNPKELFHYTSADGLKGIIENKCLWATDFQFVNDEKELVYLNDLIRMSQIDIDLSYFIKMLSEFKVHLTCFSGIEEHANIVHDGKLSQWRSYGKGGYCIVFDFNKISDCLSIKDTEYKNNKIEKVRYLKDLGELEKEELDRFSLLASAYKKNGNPQIFWYAALTAMTIKHQGFYEENEYRAIDFGKLGQNRKFRISDGAMIPYVQDFFASDDKFLQSINRVIVGPHMKKEKRALALKEFLIKHNCSADVTCSSIPYIS